MRLTVISRALFALVAAASLAACGSHGSSVPPMMPASQTQGTMPDSTTSTASFVFPDATPPKCFGQTTTSFQASKSETFSTAGGHLCIPAFGGFGGSIKYPATTTNVGATLITSTTDLGGSLPHLGPSTATPVIYFQLNTNGPVTFGATVPAGGGLTGAGIVAGRIYTIFAQVTVFGFAQNLTPCYKTATIGTYGGVLSGFGTLLKSQSVPAAANAVVEVYKTKTTATTKC